MEQIYVNSNVNKVISADVKNNTLNHGYLLISNDKFKINKFADFAACTILAQNDFQGVTAQKILHNNHADVKFYPSQNKSILTDDVNKIVEDSFVLPMEGDKKIYVLKNFEQATIQAQNKLLKTLEEPCSSVIFIITTTNESGVLATIKSRCKKITERATQESDVTRFIKSQVTLTEDNLKKILQTCEGNLTIINEYLSNDAYLQMVNLSEEIFNTLVNSSNVLALSSKMQKFKANIEDLLNIMLLTLRKMFENKVHNKQTYNINYSSKAIVEISKVINNAIKKYKSNCNLNTICDGVLMGILEVRYKCQK